MEEFTLRKWLSNVHRVLDESVSRCYPKVWKEDVVTAQILLALDEMEKVKVAPYGDPDTYDYYSVEWEAFKLDGKLEYNAGDVAVLVRTFTPGFKPVEGVGFFEAKVRYPKDRRRGKDDFTGIKSWEQLDRMRHNVPHHHLVLYDWEGIQPGRVPPVGWRYFYDLGGKTRAVSLPTNLARFLELKTIDIYTWCTDLTYQLCLRYLSGLDLEFDSHFVEEAKGTLWERSVGPSFLLVATVVHNDGGVDRELSLGDRFVRIRDVDLGRDSPNQRLKTDF